MVTNVTRSCDLRCVCRPCLKIAIPPVSPPACLSGAFAAAFLAEYTMVTFMACVVCYVNAKTIHTFKISKGKKNKLDILRHQEICDQLRAFFE